MMELKNCNPKTIQDWDDVVKFETIIIEGEDIEYTINSVNDPLYEVQ